MKLLHRADLFGWSAFDAQRQIDFHSVLWQRNGGNVLIDPLPLSAHDERHLDALGGAALIIVTNSDHVRGAARIAERTGAELAGPRAERASLPLPCARWLGDGDQAVTGLAVFEVQGSKTDGELSLVLEHTTLITGDWIRCHRGGVLSLLPDAKLRDPAAARASLHRLRREHPRIEAVVPLDGWPVFRGGATALAELAAAQPS